MKITKYRVTFLPSTEIPHSDHCCHLTTLVVLTGCERSFYMIYSAVTNSAKVSIRNRLTILWTGSKWTPSSPKKKLRKSSHKY